jgi:hypothetical protein
MYQSTKESNNNNNKNNNKKLHNAGLLVKCLEILFIQRFVEGKTANGRREKAEEEITAEKISAETQTLCFALTQCT